MPDYRHALSAFLKLADASAEPVGAAPAGVELGIDLNLRHVNMRLDLADATLVEDITAVLGQPIPVMANTFSVGAHALYWLGPDEWQIVTGEDGDHNTGGVQGTAMRVINAIPAVCAHAPGLISTLDLPRTPTKNVLSAASLLSGS